VYLLVLAAVVFAALFPSLGGDFLGWDDDVLVLRNRFLLAGRWLDLATMRILGNWHPVTLFSLALDHKLFGLNPFGFHLTSVLLHVANSLLVALLLMRLFPSHLFYPLVCGAVFGLHPLHVESVAWIGERKDLLSTFFYLLALLVHLRHCDSLRDAGPNSLARLFLVWLLGFAALLSKPMAVSLPVVLLALDWHQARRLDLRCWLEKLPLFAAALGVGIVTLFAQEPPDPNNFAVYGLNFLTTLGFAVSGVVFYAAKTLFPENLSIYYDWQYVSVEPHQYGIVLAAFAGLLWFAFQRRDSRRDIVFGLVFWIVSLAPVLKLVPFGFDSLFNDRYMYLPSVGFFLAFGRPLLDLQHWARAAQWVTLLVVACLLMTIGIQSFERSSVFTSDERLWGDVLAKYPGTPIAHDQLGFSFETKAGNLAAAREQYRLALASRPSFWRAHYHMAGLLEGEERYEEATRSYEEALRLRSSDAVFLVNAAAFFSRRGDDDRALALLEAATEAAPDFTAAHHNLANLYMARGQSGRAKAGYQTAIELAPDLPLSYSALAKIFEREGDLALALEYEKAARERGFKDSQSLQRLRRLLRPGRKHEVPVP